MRPSPGKVAVVVALALGSGLGLERGGAATGAVTLNVGEYRNANGVRVTVFAGTVSSGAADEQVDVLGRDCGVRGFRLVAGTRTRAGGAWRVENPLAVFPWSYTPVYSGITYRARWKDELSEPHVWALPAPLSVRKVGRRAWRVSTSPPPPGTVKMRGKLVELQRLTGGSWRTVQRKPLVFRPRYVVQGGPFNHEVVFEVPRRGWRLRAHLPPRSAAPCHLAGTSEEWRS